MAVLVRSGQPGLTRPAGRLLPGAESQPDEPGPNALQQLSRTAVRYGASLGMVDRRRLAMRLYLFHRLPLTRRWSLRFPDPAAVIRGWGLSGRPASAFGDGWHWMAAADHRYWWSWSTHPGGPISLAGKLYVSPAPDHLAPVLSTTVRALTATRSWVSLKVAADPAGLLRPDRLVCHFADPDELLGTARRLSTELASVPAHGVPFTSLPARRSDGGASGLADRRGASGIVSIATDPPADQGRLSWRWWVSLRIADALLGTTSEDHPGEQPESAARRVLRECEELVETRFPISRPDEILEIPHA